MAPVTLEGASAGQILRKKRSESGESLRDAADRIGISFTMLSIIEGDKNQMSLALATKILDAYEFTPEERWMCAMRWGTKALQTGSEWLALAKGNKE